jgi:hypothetical protein
MVAQLEILTEITTEIPPKPDISNLITEDDTPVDNLGSEKQQRFLTSILYSARKEQIFLASANVGIYHHVNEPPIVPDFFLSLDVQTHTNLWEKKHRCYLVWEFGKMPEVAMEIVSNKKGGELDEKLKIYQRMRVIYYVVYDPKQHLSEKVLRIFKLTGINYVETTETWLEGVNLGLTFWEGEFEGLKTTWLRWCDEKGNILFTGDELAQEANKKAENAEKNAQEAKKKAENAENELQKLREKLRQQGINFD